MLCVSLKRSLCLLLSLKFCLSLLIKRSIVLTDLMTAPVKSPTYYRKIVLENDPAIYNGFLLTFTNRIEMTSTTCEIFDNLILLEINGRNISFGCSHYLVYFAESPLVVRFMPAVLAAIKERIAVVVSGVRFSCSPFNMFFRSCPNHPLLCVPRSLFCDKIDNCGMNMDEQNCAEPNEHITLSVVDSRSQVYFSIICGSLAIVTVFISVLILFLYRWYVRARGGYCSKYVKNIFGTHQDLNSNYEAEETVALLTLGLKQMLPHMPSRRLSHYHSVHYGTMF